MGNPSKDEYTAVIFVSRRARDRSGTIVDDPGYAAAAARMVELARSQPGFVGIESVRDADGVGITVSYFESDAAARAWKQHPEHLAVQRLGRSRWYESYHLRVATVERSYAWQRPTTVLHMALPDDWSAALTAGEYTISTRGVTLAEEGFIHCSYAHQVEGVANRFYADLDHLLLLHVDTTLLAAELVVEPPFNGAPDDFPHIYGAITLDAVVAVRDWRRRGGEAWSSPPATP